MTAAERKTRLDNLKNKTVYDLNWFYKKQSDAPEQYQDVAFLLSEIDRRDEILNQLNYLFIATER